MLQKGGLEGPVFYSSDDDYLRNGLENGPLRYKKKRRGKKKKKKNLSRQLSSDADGPTESRIPNSNNKLIGSK